MIALANLKEDKVAADIIEKTVKRLFPDSHLKLPQFWPTDASRNPLKNIRVQDFVQHLSSVDSVSFNQAFDFALDHGHENLFKSIMDGYGSSRRAIVGESFD
jgi:hypothetical protein